MKHLNLLLIAAVSVSFLFSCGPEGPDASDAAQQTDSVKVEAPQLTDGHHVYTEQEIDSLRFTAQANPENGIYVVLRQGRSIDLLPVEAWEQLTNRKPEFMRPDQPGDAWLVYHRLERIPVQTAAKPMEITEVEGGFELSISFDGATATRLSALREKWPGQTLTVLVDGKGTELYSDDSRINAEGARIFAKDRDALSAIKEALK
jgi:hypothetical protein